MRKYVGYIEKFRIKEVIDKEVTHADIPFTEASRTSQ